MRILIADDENGIRSLFTTILRSNLSDVQVDVVVNGAEAVDGFRNGNYDVVLMDLHMPVKNGYQAAIEIQEMCRMENLKMPFIIFCTAFSASEEVRELLADDKHYCMLKKPVTCDQIVEAVKAVQAAP